MRIASNAMMKMPSIKLSDTWVRQQLIQRLPATEKLRASFKNALKGYRSIAELLSSALFPSALTLAVSTKLVAGAVRAVISEDKTLFNHSKILESRGLSSTARNLKAVIDRLPDFQAFVYATDEFYRDHIEHQIRVAVLGDFLLSQHFGYDHDRLSLSERICSITGLTEENVLKAWWIASLFHDVGIPIAKLSKNMNDFVNDLAMVYGNLNLKLPPIGSLIIDENRNRVMFEALTTGFSRLIIKKFRIALGWDGTPIVNHGALSALLVLNSIPELGGVESDKLKERFEEDYRAYLIAARAMMLHDLYQDNNRIEIHSHRDPIAYLLVCCDEMQEWNRDVSMKRRSVFDPRYSIVQLMDHCIMDISDNGIEFTAEYRNQEAKDSCGFIFDYCLSEKSRDLVRLRDANHIFPKLTMNFVDYVFQAHRLLGKVQKTVCTNI